MIKINRKTIIIAACAAAAYYGYGYFFGNKQDAGYQGEAIPVSVAEVIEREVRPQNEFSGKLVAVEQVEIRPQVSGIIKTVHFADGAEIKKGDLLFTVDPRPFEAAANSANSLWVLANDNLKRAKALVESKSIPQSEYDKRKNDAESAKAVLEKAKIDLGYTQITSPISGKAGRAEITAGNLVNAGPNAPLLTAVVSRDPIYADFDMDEASFVKYARAGVTSNAEAVKIPVTVELEGLKREGRVASFDNRIGSTSGTVRVRAIFDNKDGTLIPGLFSSVKISAPLAEKTLLISDKAVGTNQSKKFVLVVGDDNKAENREITLGGTADGLRIVTSGLKPGEKVIVGGMQRVRQPMQPVTPEIVPPEGDKK